MTIQTISQTVRIVKMLGGIQRAKNPQFYKVHMKQKSGPLTCKQVGGPG